MVAGYHHFRKPPYICIYIYIYMLLTFRVLSTTDFAILSLDKSPTLLGLQHLLQADQLLPPLPTSPWQ